MNDQTEPLTAAVLAEQAVSTDWLHDLDLKRIRQFVVLAETLNITRAAGRLHLAQPALSVAIRRLEEDIGTPLFVREPRGVRLTPGGKAALIEAQRVLLYADRLRAAARGAAEGTGGVLRVGFVSSATYGLLQRLVPVFRREHPDVKLTLREGGNSGAILRWLDEREIDTGILRTPLLEECRARMLELETDWLIAAIHEQHPLAEGGLLRLAELKDEPFVMYPRREAPGMRSAAMLACQEAGFVPHITQEGVQITTILSLAGSGLGIGLVPSVVRTFANPGVVYRAFSDMPPAARVGLSLIYDDSDELPASRLFRESVRRTLGVEG